MYCTLQTFSLVLKNKALQHIVLQEIINFYNSQNTNVYCTLLDASKGFNRIESCMLFKKLIRRGMCSLIVRLLMFMYANQLLYIKGTYTVYLVVLFYVINQKLMIPLPKTHFHCITTRVACSSG